ncbi:hypothetical protein FRC12_010882 [Ceratobasidium sp. 428]|nr:hypothetical protein FRC12_010882 [Ceratobasidium sp. 428]
MPQRRFHFIASENYRPRSNVDIPPIGRLLKTLKSSSKNIRSGQKHLLTEMHLLERVYYKGKNQHGLSLFWRNVVSIRRMASRIHETNTPRLLEMLAGMFHEEAFTGTKVFNGAWTRIPPPENVAKILERLLDVATLLKSANKAFLKAYRAFCLFMPTTAFLQLTIVLISIVSRISALASNLLDDLVLIIPRLYAVFEVLKPSRSLYRKVSKSIKIFSPASPIDSISDNVINAQSTPALSIHEPGEDIGFTIARTIQPTITLPPTIHTARLTSPPPIYVPDSAAVAANSPIALETVIPRSPSPSRTTLAPLSRENFPVELEAADAAPIRPKIVPHDAGVTTKRDKRRRRDEIDEIFG